MSHRIWRESYRFGTTAAGDQSMWGRNESKRQYRGIKREVAFYQDSREYQICRTYPLCGPRVSCISRGQILFIQQTRIGSQGTDWWSSLTQTFLPYKVPLPALLGFSGTVWLASDNEAWTQVTLFTSELRDEKAGGHSFWPQSMAVSMETHNVRAAPWTRSSWNSWEEPDQHWMLGGLEINDCLWIQDLRV